MNTDRVGTIRRSHRGRVAVLELDYPDRSMNVVDERVLVDLRKHLQAIADDDGVVAMVLTSAKPGSFGVGADLSWLPLLAARADAAEFLADVHELMVALVRSSKPLVAALNGPAFGGALELALGARAIVAVPEATVGLPEITLELLPGGGGTQFLTRFVGVDVAAELLTSGRRVEAVEAQRLGLYIDVVAPDRLLDVAVRRAEGLVGTTSEARSVDSEVAALVAVARRREELANSRSGLSSAADHILTALRVGIGQGLAAGLASEREGFLAQLRSPEARAAIHVFQAEADVKRRSRTGKPRIQRLGVVGAGQMGAGIAATAVARGLHAVVRDVSEDSLDHARSYLDKVLARSGPPEADESAADGWVATTGWEGFADADGVIEAVFELPELKKDVLSELSDRVDADILVATNTSAISIEALATAVVNPERFLGMHFFNPVDRMRLVELIPHGGSSPEIVERAASLGRYLGKVPVVVGDRPGFFTSRVYARWLIEGIRLLLDGVVPGEVEAAARDVGFPVGPLRAHDEATLDLVLEASITQVAEHVMSERLNVADVRRALEQLVADGMRGRRHGRGFYRYGADGRRLGPDDDILGGLGVTSSPPSRAVVAERLLLAFVTECFLCWDDGTLCHPDDGDIASILGIGFPRVLGGPFHWADEVGAAEILRRCEAVGVTQFPGGVSLERFAVEGGRFAEQPRRPAPLHESPEIGGTT